ncbi:hypothetical protein ACWW2O_004822 [Escherichia coli]|nr:hypothetical protein [Escherichia coli]EKQ4402534.1 hypothetical protein [Escherichia coli]
MPLNQNPLDFTIPFLPLKPTIFAPEILGNSDFAPHFAPEMPIIAPEILGNSDFAPHFAPEMPIIAPENLIFAPEICPRKGLVRKLFIKH